MVVVSQEKEHPLGFGSFFKVLCIDNYRLFTLRVMTVRSEKCLTMNRNILLIMCETVDRFKIGTVLNQSAVVIFITVNDDTVTHLGDRINVLDCFDINIVFKPLLLFHRYTGTKIVYQKLYLSTGGFELTQYRHPSSRSLQSNFVACMCIIIDHCIFPFCFILI